MRWPVSRDSRLAWGLCTLALLAAATVFVIRTISQPHYTGSDAAVYYTGSRVWLAGENPYDRTIAPGIWTAAGGSDRVMPENLEATYDERWLAILQTPPTLALLAPLALLPAKPAIVLWYVFASALLLAQTAALASLMGSSLFRPRGLLLLAATLMLAPIHECFGYAQPSGPAISLIILGLWAATKRRDLLAGAILAVATALKPQLAAPFVIYYFLVGRRRLPLSFAMVFAVLCAIAIAPMQLRAVPWMQGWLENFRIAEAPMGMNSAATDHIGRFHLLNLQVILHGVIEERTIVNAFAIAITVFLAAVFALWRQRGRGYDELLCMSIVALLALMPAYHRYYDAALMVLPLAWGIAYLRSRPRAAWVVLIFVMSFVVPIALVRRLAPVLGLDFQTASGFAWDVLVEPSRAWSILVGFALLLYAMSPASKPRAARGVAIEDARQEVSPAV